MFCAVEPLVHIFIRTLCVCMGFRYSSRENPHFGVDTDIKTGKHDRTNTNTPSCCATFEKKKNFKRLMRRQTIHTNNSHTEHSDYPNSIHTNPYVLADTDSDAMSSLSRGGHSDLLSVWDNDKQTHTYTHTTRTRRGFRVRHNSPSRSWYPQRETCARVAYFAAGGTLR